MRKIALLLLPVVLLLTSCATVLNKKEYDIKFTGAQPNLKVKVNDSIYSLPAKVKVKRSIQDLPITVISDSVTKQAIIEHAMSPEFFYMNMNPPFFAPFSYGIDLFYGKAFYYGKNLVLDDTTSVYKPSVFNPYKKYFGKTTYGKKGQWNLIAGVPFGNLFYMQPRNLMLKNEGGLLGVLLGFEYYYSQQKFLKITMSNAINSISPFPLGYDRLRSQNFTLTNNYAMGRIIFGYGINYSIYTWERKGSDYDEDPLALPHSKKNSHAFGTSLSLHNQFANYLRFGITYNPTFYSVFPKDEWLYQHVISFEVIFRLPLNEKFKFRWK